MSQRLPWHQRGVRVHRLVYRGWYIVQLVAGAILLLSAVAPIVLLAMNTITDSMGFILTAIAAAITGLVGILLSWLAIHRLRHPIKPTP